MANDPFGDSFGGNGNLDDLPWATVFDPAANARALSAIQAEGFRAASQLVDRFARMAAQTSRPGTDAPSGLEQMTRTWWSTFGRILLGGEVRSAEFDLGGQHDPQSVALASVGPGCANAEVWLHNRGAQDFGQVRLRCSDLLAADGCVIGSEMVRLEPQVVPMPSRCSRGIAMEVEVAQDIRPGVYRGTLLADCCPELWLPVVLTVVAPTS